MISNQAELQIRKYTLPSDNGYYLIDVDKKCRLFVFDTNLGVALAKFLAEDANEWDKFIDDFTHQGIAGFFFDGLIEDVETLAAIGRGLIQVANGEVHDLGSFSQYAD